MRHRFLLIALLSVTLISMELIWTRIFSAEFFYTFAFLVLSLAVMGLGLGALGLRLFASWNKEGALGLFLSLTGLTALAGPPLVFAIGLSFAELVSSWLMLGKFILAVLLLGSSFVCGGVSLALLFKRHHKEMPRLYMADLIGAGLGVVFGILLMNLLGTPLATFWAVSPVLLAALIATTSWRRAIPVALLIAMALLGFSAEPLLRMERQERGPVIYTHWDAMAKVKVFDFGTHRGLEVDNVANSPVYPFDGNWDRPDSMRFEFGIPVDYLIHQFDSCTFLSLGSGGGVDVLQALQEGATEIHAVEINPHINRMMLEGDPDGYFPVDSGEPHVTTNVYSGNIYNDPRVRVVSEDARAYVRRHPNTFDVIYSLSSNTWAALASGSFALAENYLFTTDAFMDYWNALSDSGYMMMEHQFYVSRMVGELMEALDRSGVENPGDHFAVYALPSMRRKAILLSKRPLTDSLRYHALVDLTPEVAEYIHLLYPAPDSLADNMTNKIIQNGWRAMSDSIPIDISPCGDDRPFTAQLGLWRNFSIENLKKHIPYDFYGFPMSKAIIVVILGVVLMLVVPLNLLPYLKAGPRLRAAPWLYFFLIGVAFMIIEVILIQKYTLFVGAPLYSMVTVLLTLLVASGIGSRFAATTRDGVAFTGILVWLLLDIFVFRFATNWLGGLPLVGRLLTTAIIVAPLGFFMGMPFPKAALRVGELVDWGFAVNGAASVLGATAVMLVAFAWGFSAALTVAGLCYLLAYLLLLPKMAWKQK